MQPQLKGTTITIPIPLFTHDQKGAVEKIAKGIANQAKDGLRKIRQKGMIDIRNNKEGNSKDLIRRIENQVSWHLKKCVQHTVLIILTALRLFSSICPYSVA